MHGSVEQVVGMVCTHVASWERAEVQLLRLRLPQGEARPRRQGGEDTLEGTRATPRDCPLQDEHLRGLQVLMGQAGKMGLHSGVEAGG